jgi:hypothetical protein
LNRPVTLYTTLVVAAWMSVPLMVGRLSRWTVARTLTVFLGAAALALCLSLGLGRVADNEATLAFNRGDGGYGEAMKVLEWKFVASRSANLETLCLVTVALAVGARRRITWMAVLLVFVGILWLCLIYYLWLGLPLRLA